MFLRFLLRNTNLTTQFLNPPELGKTFGWTQVTTSVGGKTIYLSGQTSVNASGGVVGKGDLKAQAIQTFENVKTALAAAGATVHDMVKMNIYVVGLKPDQVPIIREIRARYVSPDKPPASTFVGVPALVNADWLIEIDGIAVVADQGEAP